jgi:hypothetical protein
MTCASQRQTTSPSCLVARARDGIVGLSLYWLGKNAVGATRSADMRGYGAPLSRTAVDFDSTMRRFESSRPSQAVRRSARLPKKRENRPEMPAFRAVDFVSRLPNR